jgi:carbon-monoxide dehydrogenase medium subunit
MTLAAGDVCQDVRIALGSAGLTPIHATDAEQVLRGKALSPNTIDLAAEAAVAAAEPVEDMRGSEAFKRSVLAVLVKRAIDAAVRRCKGEQVEMSHEYY